ncbi:MAG TPA: hypothetical protein DEA22_03400 [Blastocatellia bacterium]|nr:hypothetical protein [Blastocatellia bacterium]
MPTHLSPLQLDGYFLKELSFYLKDELAKVPSKKTHEKTVNLEISELTLPVDKSGYRWRCELTIQSSNPEEAHFYEFKIVMIGFFSVDKEIDKKRAELIAKINAPAVLYSASREIIATVTRRSPYPGTLLPTVTFLQPTKSAEKGDGDKKGDPENRTFRGSRKRNVKE